MEERKSEKCDLDPSPDPLLVYHNFADTSFLDKIAFWMINDLFEFFAVKILFFFFDTQIEV